MEVVTEIRQTATEVTVVTQQTAMEVTAVLVLSVSVSASDGWSFVLCPATDADGCMRLEHRRRRQQWSHESQQMETEVAVEARQTATEVKMVA